MLLDKGPLFILANPSYMQDKRKLNKTVCFELVSGLKAEVVNRFCSNEIDQHLERATS